LRRAICLLKSGLLSSAWETKTNADGKYLNALFLLGPQVAIDAKSLLELRLKSRLLCALALGSSLFALGWLIYVGSLMF
jgi:hypothetical protein